MPGIADIPTPEPELQSGHWGGWTSGLSLGALSWRFLVSLEGPPWKTLTGPSSAPERKVEWTQLRTAEGWGHFRTLRAFLSQPS